ncbi:MAG TPA: response regulator [Blastocatellia bacterium]|nr:response regulator [Blastocatellia bacterium]
MGTQGTPFTVLMADDDEDDRMFTREAWEENHLANPLHFVQDGVELLEYLRREGDFVHLSGSPLPGLILLDLNMPRKDGREALAEIKADPDLRYIPMVILTTSSAEADIFRAYDLGVSSFIVKPVTFESLVGVIKILSEYWFQIVELPHKSLP